MKYVITGINRLTGEREAISLPMQEWKADLATKREKSRHAKLRQRGGLPAYTWLRKERLEARPVEMIFRDD